MQPLTLNGAGFKVNERVLVRADYGEETYFRKATTSPEGRFTVTFSRLQVSRCADHDLTVHATGSLGSRFEFTLHHHDCSSR